MNKKGNLAIIAIILAVIIFTLIMFHYTSRECSSNKECTTDSYCGTDYECHKYPNAVLIKQNNYLGAAIILGIALMVSAYIYRGGKLPRLKNKEKEV